MKRENIINLSLTTPGSLTEALKRIEDFQKGLNAKTEMFVSLLLEKGIRTAKAYGGQYKRYLHFEQNVYNDKVFDTVGLLIGADNQKIISEWYRGGEIVSAEVSPILMAEFGSGWLAQVYFPAVKGLVGQGTFPGQRNAFNEDGWYWEDPNDDEYELHHSYGETPTHPMYQALMAMINEIDRASKKAFR